VPYDLAQAYKWLSLAAGAGDQSALESKQVVEASMSPRQIDNAQSLARAWMAQSSVLPPPVKNAGVE